MVGEMVDSSLCSERDVGDAVPYTRTGGDGENKTLALRERVRVRECEICIRYYIYFAKSNG